MKLDDWTKKLIVASLQYFAGFGLIVAGAYLPIPVVYQGGLFGIALFTLGHAVGYTGADPVPPISIINSVSPPEKQ